MCPRVRLPPTLGRARSAVPAPSSVVHRRRAVPARMPEKKKQQIRKGKAVQAHDATTTQQVKAAWSHAPLGSQKRPPLPRKKAFAAAKTNAAFDAYYRGHVVPEEEWARFLEVMRSPLPTTFSFTNCSSQLDAGLVQARFEELLASCAVVDVGCDEAGRATHWAAVDGAKRSLGGAPPTVGVAGDWLTSLLELFATLTGGGFCVDRGKAAGEGGVHSASDAALLLSGGDRRRAVCVAAGGRVTLSLRARKGGVRAFCGVEEPRPRALYCRPLGWYGLGWQCDAPRFELLRLRRSLKEVRGFVQEQELRGKLSRQEAVSMLPPLLLRLGPGHAVLDLCAAPGSKTVLLLSRLAAAAAAAAGEADSGGSGGGGGGGGEGEADSGCGSPSGCVVANDVNLMRCRRLRDRLARCLAPGALLTCHAAQRMPGQAESLERVSVRVMGRARAQVGSNPNPNT